MKPLNKNILVISTITILLTFCLRIPLTYALELAEIRDKKINAVQSPSLGAPIIIQAGSDFSATVRTDIFGTVKNAWLSPIRDLESKMPLQTSSTQKANGTAFYNMKTPSDIMPGLYDLNVSNADGNKDIQPHSVKIVGEFKKDFFFVSIADIHFGDSRGQGFAAGKDLNVLRRNILQAASRVNPEFILFVGDATNEPTTYRRDYQTAWEYFKEYLDAPMFMVPGNHDSYGLMKKDGAFLDGKEYWRAFFGPTYYYFDYGNLRFIGLDNYDWPPIFRRSLKLMSESESINTGNMGKDQFEWLQKTLPGAGERTIIVFAHFPFDQMKGGAPFKGGKLPGIPKTEVLELLNKHGVSHIFIGHWHRNEIKDLIGIKQVMTNTSGSVLYSDVRWGFNTVYVKDGNIDRIEFTEVEF